MFKTKAHYFPTISIDKNNVYHFSYPELSVSMVIDLMKNSAEFRESLLTTLRQGTPIHSIFWECKPVSYSKMDHQSFDFVVLEAESLDDKKTDLSSFAEHFKSTQTKDANIGESVLTFPNIGNNAMLIVPEPLLKSTTKDSYTHLKRFLDGAPIEQQHELLTRIGHAYAARLVDQKPKPVWLSTSGLGVYFLHVRLDSRPKYYRYTPYKQWGDVFARQ